MLPKKVKKKKWRNYCISEVTRCICRCCPCCCCCWPCCSWIIFIWLASVWWRIRYFINYIQRSWWWCWFEVCRWTIACSDRTNIFTGLQNKYHSQGLNCVIIAAGSDQFWSLWGLMINSGCQILMIFFGVPLWPAFYCGMHPNIIWSINCSKLYLEKNSMSFIEKISIRWINIWIMLENISNECSGMIIQSAPPIYAYRLAAYSTLLHRFLSVPIFQHCFQCLSILVNCIFRIYAYFALLQEFFWSEHALLCVNSPG